MGKTVFIAEKPKMGRIIADALAQVDGSNIRSTGSALHGNGWSVCWLAGHAYGLFDAKDYREDWSVPWDRLPLPLIPEEFQFKPLEGDFIEGCRNAAENELKGADTVVIATDPGQEGQIIAEIFLDQVGWKGNTKRLWSSAQNVQEMTRAVTQLQPNSDQKFQGHKKCGLVRMKGDWLIGINFTIAYTNMARRAGYDFTASAGRVQSTCLAIVVDHDAMIEKFKSASYYEVEASFKTKSGASFKATLNIPNHLLHDEKHCIDEGALHKIISECSGKVAEVKGLSKNQQSFKPPKPFNLTTLCIALNRDFDLSSSEVLALYQTMYESGWLTYPRTDDEYYEDEQLDNINTLFSMLGNLDPEFAPLVSNADTSMRPASFNSSLVEEHSANSPTVTKPKWEALDIKSKNIYRTVAKQMIAQFYPDYINATTTALISVGNYSFQIKGSTVVQEGWSQVTKPLDVDTSAPLPNFEKGDVLEIENIQIVAKKTRAPARMTEAKLLGIMKNASDYLASEQTKRRLGDKATLGTAATRPGILKTLIETRKFLSRAPKGVLIPTKAGKQVRALLPPELASPDLSAIWEINFKAIRSGTLSPDEFVNKTKAWVTQQIQKASTRTIKRNPLTFPCPCCQGAMVRKSRPNKSPFWVCLECSEIIQDHEGKPLEKLSGDGESCPECGAPFKTFVRNKDRMTLEQRKKNKDLRYLRCKNGHYKN